MSMRGFTKLHQRATSYLCSMEQTLSACIYVSWKKIYSV